MTFVSRSDPGTDPDTSVRVPDCGEECRTAVVSEIPDPVPNPGQ